MELPTDYDNPDTEIFYQLAKELGINLEESLYVSQERELMENLNDASQLVRSGATSIASGLSKVSRYQLPELSPKMQAICACIRPLFQELSSFQLLLCLLEEHRLHEVVGDYVCMDETSRPLFTLKERDFAARYVICERLLEIFPLQFTQRSVHPMSWRDY